MPNSTEIRIRLGMVATTPRRYHSVCSRTSAPCRRRPGVERRARPAAAPSYRAGRARLRIRTMPSEARSQFARSAGFWVDKSPDAASVEARRLPRIARRPERADGARAKPRSARALSMRRRCIAWRLKRSDGFSWPAFKPAVDVSTRPCRYSVPSRTMPSRTIGRELLAQTHYWRSVALGGRGNWTPLNPRPPTRVD